MRNQEEATRARNLIEALYGINTTVEQADGTGEWICAFKSYPDLMRYRLMTDTMFNVRIAQLNQECPDLD